MCGQEPRARSRATQVLRHPRALALDRGASQLALCACPAGAAARVPMRAPLLRCAPARVPLFCRGAVCLPAGLESWHARARTIGTGDALRSALPHVRTWGKQRSGGLAFSRWAWLHVHRCVTPHAMRLTSLHPRQHRARHTHHTCPVHFAQLLNSLELHSQVGGLMVHAKDGGGESSHIEVRTASVCCCGSQAQGLPCDMQHATSVAGRRPRTRRVELGLTSAHLLRCPVPPAHRKA